MIGGTNAHDGFAVGWYGKIPGTGDFIARRVPASFREPWDRWLQGAIDSTLSNQGPAASSVATGSRLAEGSAQATASGK